jgi:ribosome biogenesis protein Tsr3
VVIVVFHVQTLDPDSRTRRRREARIVAVCKQNKFECPHCNAIVLDPVLSAIIGRLDKYIVNRSQVPTIVGLRTMYFVSSLVGFMLCSSFDHDRQAGTYW